MIHIQPFEDLGRFDNDWLAARSTPVKRGSGARRADSRGR